MSDSEDQEQKEVIAPIPPNKVRYTDFNEALVEKFIRAIDEAVKAMPKAGTDTDKLLAKKIQAMVCKDPDTIDEACGWHVIIGTSFASAITYQTKNVLFFDLLGDCNKSFLIFKTSEHPKHGQDKKR